MTVRPLSQANDPITQRLALSDDDPVELGEHRGEPLGDRIVGLTEGADGHGPFPYRGCR